MIVNLMHFFAGRRYAKSVTYSFGVILLEMLTGQRAVATERPAGQCSLVEWVRPHVSKRRVAKVVDPRLGELYPLEGALDVAKLAFDCLQTDHEKRPSLTEAHKRLEEIQNLRSDKIGILTLVRSLLTQEVQAPSLLITDIL